MPLVSHRGHGVPTVTDGRLDEDRRVATHCYGEDGLVHWKHYMYGAWCSAGVDPVKRWPGAWRGIVTCLFCQAGRTGLEL